MRRLDNILERLSLAVLLVGGLGMLIAMFLGTGDVVGTQFFGWPLQGAKEITESTMVLIVFGALAYAEVTGHNIVIGKKTWNKFPKDIQDIFLDQAKKTHADYLAWLTDFEARAVKNIQKAGGVVKEFPRSELAKWTAMAPDVLDVWVKDMEKRGQGDMAKRVAKRWREWTK